MFEAVIVVGLFAVLLLAGGRRREPTIRLPDLGPDTDLPCPWCLAPTRESDESCQSCGQRFGTFETKDRSSRSS